jgi:uncharacterized phage infection (PIP) family protein YhgE
MPDQDRTKQALAALAAECAVYSRILELTREQSQLAESGSAEELLSVLAEKGKLAEEAARISEQSRELKSNWGARATELAPEDAARGQKLLDQIAQVLKEILAEEDACQQAIGKRREGAMEDLLRLQKGRKIAKAYGQKPAQDPRFKDERK